MEDTVYTRKFRKELMAGLSSLVLLAVLARAAREMYGYEIAKAVKAEGEGGLIFKQGAIYPVLRSLNTLGLLDSRVEASAFGPPRRYYSITDEGKKALADWQGAWRDMREFVDEALVAQEPTMSTGRQPETVREYLDALQIALKGCPLPSSAMRLPTPKSICATN